MEKSSVAGGERRGRELKRSRLSSSGTSSMSELEKSDRTPCLVSHHRNGFGPMLYAVDSEETSYNRRNFCKKCRTELTEEGEDNDLGTEGKESNRPQLRRITPLRSGWVPVGQMFVALGSTVYVLGGLYPHLSRDVYYFETTKSTDEAEADGQEKKEGRIWKQGPKMLSGRCKGGALAVEGKIYVFGGNYNEIKSRRDWGPWAEVFDPTINEWEPLPGPPFYYDDYESRYVQFEGPPIAAYGKPGDKKILLGGNDIKYVYHVKSGTWEELEWFVFGARVRPIGVGNYLYYAEDGHLVATNMKTKRKFLGEIEGSRLGLPDGFSLCCQLGTVEEPLLVHLGGKDFCFFSLRTLSRSGRTRVRYTKFRISKLVRAPPGEPESKMGNLKAFVVSTVAYIVDQPLNLKGHGLLLDGIPGSIKDGDVVQNVKRKELEEAAAKEVARKRKRERELPTHN